MSTTELPPEVVPVRAGDELDWDALEAYLRREIPELRGEMQVMQFPDGTANLTFFVRMGDTALVVRRPPFGALAPGAHDMAREHRVLSRLWRHYEQAPRAYAFCDDPSVIGADFFVMEYRSGEVIRQAVPESMAHHGDLGRRVGDAFVDAVAHLHQLDPVECDLSDLGKPEGFCARQVAGWSKRWELARPEGGVASMDAVTLLLAGDVPEPQRVSVLHNDLHLGNCQFDPEEPDRVKSLFDWDMSTLGDPLFDFGGLLAYWRDGDDPGRPADPLLQLPTKSAATERYATATGLDVGDIGWYHGFAMWKNAIIRQQLFNRFQRGESNDPRLATFGDAVQDSGERALALLQAR